MPTPTKKPIAKNKKPVDNAGAVTAIDPILERHKHLFCISPEIAAGTYANISGVVSSPMKRSYAFMLRDFCSRTDLPVVGSLVSVEAPNFFDNDTVVYSSPTDLIGVNVKIGTELHYISNSISVLQMIRAVTADADIKDPQASTPVTLFGKVIDYTLLEEDPQYKLRVHLELSPFFAEHNSAKVAITLCDYKDIRALLNTEIVPAFSGS